jgi:hypothetical protein
MIYKAPIELYDIMESVVDSMRETAGIGLIIADGTNWKYPATNTLSANDYISITDGVTTWSDQRVISATSTYFILSDYYAATEFKANAPYFMCEKEQKAANILTEKTKQDTYKWQKYPLVLLTRPYTDDRTSQMIGYSVDFNIHILYNTESTYWADDRITTNFTPILYPLYVSFLNKLVLNRWVKEKDPNKLTHDKTDLLLVSNAANDANSFPDVLDGITIAFSDLEVLKNITPCEAEELEQFNLTLSSDANGTATSSVGAEGVIVVNSGTNVAAYADANAGYKFSQWLRNTIPISLNPYAFIMNQDITLTAEFIVSIIKQLQIAVSGTGTTSPIPGNYDREQGTFQLIEAIETDVLYYFDEFKQDGLALVGNPVNVEIADNTLVVAYFVEYLQWVFNTAITKIVDLYYFPDFTSRANNVQIKQSQKAKFNGINSYINTGEIAETAGELEIWFDLDSIVPFTNFIGSYNVVESKRLFIGVITDNKLAIGLGTQGSSALSSNYVLTINTPYRVKLIYDQADLSYNLLVDSGAGYVSVKSGNFTGGFISDEVIYVGATYNGSVPANHAQINVCYVNVTNKINYQLKESWGTEIINTLPLKSNGTVIGSNEAYLWSEKSDYAKPLESYAYTLFQQIADPTKFIRAIYDTAGNPTKTTITGYNKIAEIPANVVSNTGAVYSGIQIAGLEVDATFTEVLAIENSATVEITKDANTVSLLKIKQ